MCAECAMIKRSVLEKEIFMVKGHLTPSFRVYPILLSALLLVVGLSGCNTTGNKTAGTSNTTSPGGTSTTPTGGENVLRYALTSEPTSLDPATVQDGTTIDLLQNVFEGLVMWNEQNQIVPNIAEKWDVSADGKTYTFHLKKGVKFHNGREVTAEDFKYSLERACDPETKSQTVSSYLNDIVGANDRINGVKGVTSVAGVKAVDASTLQITIDAPKSYWLSKLTYPAFYVVCKEAIEKNKGQLDENSLIGSGPFKLEGFRRGYEVSLVANLDYHGGRPKLDKLIRPIIKEGSTRLNKYEAGELDIVDVSPRDLNHVNGVPKLKADLKSFLRAATWYVSLNSAAANSPFGKKEVRQAFAYAIDRAEVVRVALKGQVDVAEGVVPPGMASFESKLTPLKFDVTKAKEMLAKAGYPGGKGFPALTLSFRNDQPQVADTAQVVAAQLKTNLGIDIQLRPMEWGTFLTERNRKTLALSHLRWAADYLDPQNFLSVLLHTSKLVNGKEDHPENGSGYSNAEFDKLCDQGDVEQDAQKRKALYQQAEQIAVDDAPWVPIYFQKDLELVRPNVKNLRDSMLGHLPHVTTTVTP